MIEEAKSILRCYLCLLVIVAMVAGCSTTTERRGLNEDRAAIFEFSSPDGYATPSEDITRAAMTPASHAVLPNPDGSVFAIFSFTENVPMEEASLARAPIPGLSRFDTFDVLSLMPSALPRFSDSIILRERRSGDSISISLPIGSRATSPAWSPDGTQLAFILWIENEFQLWVASRSTGKAWPISFEAPSLFLWGQYSKRASSAGGELPFVPYFWDADSRTIFFAARSSPGIEKTAAYFASVRQAEIRATNSVPDSAKAFGVRTSGIDVELALAKRLFKSKIVAVQIDNEARSQSIGQNREYVGLSVSPSGVTQLALVANISKDEIYYDVMRLVRDGWAKMTSLEVGSIDRLTFGELVWSAGDNVYVFVLLEKDGLHCLEKIDVALDTRVTVDCLGEAIFPTQIFGSSLSYTQSSIIVSTSAGTARIYDRASGEPMYELPLPELNSAYSWHTMRVGADRAIASGHSSDYLLLSGILLRDASHRNFDFGKIVSWAWQSGGVSEIWSRDYNQDELLTPEFADEIGDVYYSKESPSTPRNLFRLSVYSGEVEQVTDFQDPFPQFNAYGKRILSYRRNDGIRLTARLVLPDDNAHLGSKYPLFVWQYPAARSRPINENFRDGMFVRPNSHGGTIAYWLPLVMLEQGYAVMYPEFPLLGVDGDTSYGSYVDQTIANAEAAVEAAQSTGLIDTRNIAIGGHSAGGQNAATLLAKTDLFTAGISVSGPAHWIDRPYNIQYDSRDYWEYSKGFIERSPILSANTINEPLLLIHGKDDRSPGVGHSISLFETIKNLGGTAKLIMLDEEGHNIRILEHQLLVQAEALNWLDTYLCSDCR